MKKWFMVLGFVVVMGVSSVSEASMVSRGLGKTWNYLFAPVNCVANLGVDLLNAGTKFVLCFLNNANPQNIIP